MILDPAERAKNDYEVIKLRTTCVLSAGMLGKKEKDKNITNNTTSSNTATRSRKRQHKRKKHN